MTKRKTPTSSKGVKSVDTAFEVIDIIRESDGARITDLAEELGVSKSTIHAHLTTLQNRRLVVKEGNEFYLGIRFLTLGGAARAREKMTDITREEVKVLAEETGGTAQIVIEDQGQGICLSQVRGKNSIKTGSYIGACEHLHCTAAGKAILSRLPTEKVETIIETHGLPRRTENTITSRSVLFDELEEIRERGYALEDGERIRGVRAVAAPIFRKSEVYGGLAISGSLKRFQKELFREEFPDLIKRSARTVEINYLYS
ncbi:IclR family transcriptional regulator (plasmid) [Haloferax prahovense]|uniref:IclR family transcriptional regulator n=1 Tax=Haloferax prahovense TaxID=381852 RepID=UPI003C71F538